MRNNFHQTDKHTNNRQTHNQPTKTNNRESKFHSWKRGLAFKGTSPNDDSQFDIKRKDFSVGNKREGFGFGRTQGVSFVLFFENSKKPSETVEEV
jgi:hypothetical protein